MGVKIRDSTGGTVPGVRAGGADGERGAGGNGVPGEPARGSAGKGWLNENTCASDSERGEETEKRGGNESGRSRIHGVLIKVGMTIKSCNLAFITHWVLQVKSFKFRAIRSVLGLILPERRRVGSLIQ